jgi:hypothetical protein
MTLSVRRRQPPITVIIAGSERFHASHLLSADAGASLYKSAENVTMALAACEYSHWTRNSFQLLGTTVQLLVA